MLRTTRLASLLLVAVLAITGCTAVQNQPAAPARGGTVVRAMASEPADLDPQGPASSGLSLILPYLYDTLITRQRDGQYTGLLAESWQGSADGKTLEVKLKSGVKFHDGSALNAEAVVFTFGRFKDAGNKSPIAGDVKNFSRIEAVDDLTVRFVSAEPNATALNTISMPYAGILSPAAVSAAGAEMGRKPVGTGPFKLGDWVQGVGITLVRNPDYSWASTEVKNRGPVYLDKMIFRPIPDANTQLAALKAGEADIIFTNDPEQLKQLRSDKSVSVADADIDALIYLGYNCAKPPFDEVTVRQALSYAVNRSEVISLALGGLGVEAVTPLTPRMIGYNPELKAYGQGYDPAKAKALLSAAGFAPLADGGWQRDGKKLAAKLLTSNRAPNDAIATVIQSQLKAIGVPVEIQQLDSSAVMKASTEGSFDLLLWRYDWSDPDALNIYLSSSRIKQTNRVFYANPEVDALLAKGRTEFDLSKRATIYQDAQKIILAEAPWQPLYVPVEGIVARGRVQGLVVGFLGRLLVNDVTVTGA